MLKILQTNDFEAVACCRADFKSTARRSKAVLISIHHQKTSSNNIVQYFIHTDVIEMTKQPVASLSLSAIILYTLQSVLR